MYYDIEDYNYDLPQSLIAQAPADRRDRSRLLRLKRPEGTLSHHRFDQLTDLLKPSDVMVVNNTEVIPGRIVGRKATGGRVEMLILNYARPGKADGGANTRVYQCLVKAAKTPRPGTTVTFDHGLSATVGHGDAGIFSVEFASEENFEAALYKTGKMPLPPYIKRDDASSNGRDRDAYQTVYAKCKGAVAAPTAGLHFTDELLNRLSATGVIVVPITLHVGYGTFVPVRVTDIREHRMHSEWFTLSAEAAGAISKAKADGRRIIAVGTTSVRTLEYAAGDNGRIRSMSGNCDLFIYPGYRFKMVDAMITNFHLPKSTLLMLVSAFAGRDHILAAYREAVKEQYRFFSYGDAMFIG